MAIGNFDGLHTGHRMIIKRAMERAHLPQEEIDQFMKEAMSGDYNHLLATTMAWFDVE